MEYNTGRNDNEVVMGKNRLLLVLRYLWEETDEENTVSAVDIMDYLESQGMSRPTRNSVYSDIAALKEAGFEIETYRSVQNRYKLVQRGFSTAELQLLTDAVQAARFIPRKQSKELVRKLSGFAGKSRSGLLDRKLLNVMQTKSTNENLLFVVNELQYAISRGKKTRFRYIDYNIRKRKVYRHEGQVYSVSPYSMLWNGDNYYMVGFSDSHGKIACFRVDRIDAVLVTDENAVRKPKGYREEDYYSEIFSMFDGPSCEAVLLCDADMMNVIVDRFGTGVKTEVQDEGHFTASVTVHLSKPFYGWLCSLAGKVRLISPQYAVDELHALVRDL